MVVVVSGLRRIERIEKKKKKVCSPSLPQERAEGLFIRGGYQYKLIY